MILRKINTQVRTTADAVASGAVVQFLRAGAKVSRDPGGGSIAVDHPGSIVNGDSLFVVRSGTKLAGVNVNITSDWTYQSGAGDWTATVTIGGTYTPADGDRLVGDYESGDGLTLTWADDLGVEDQQSSITLGSSGMIERYTKDFDVDLRINNGGTITWAFDISTEPRTEVRPEDFADSRNVANGYAIQKALDYLRDIGGGVLRLGDATYDTSTTLNIQGDNISICGCGPSSVIRQTGTSTGAISTIQIDDGVDGVTLQNFKITVTGAFGTLGRGAVMVNSGTGLVGNKNHRYDGLLIASAGTGGIVANGLKDSIISNCIMDNGGGIYGEHGIYLSDGYGGTGANVCSRVAISNCVIRNSGFSASPSNKCGIQLAASTDITISNCQIDGWHNGILTTQNADASNITISNCIISGSVVNGGSTGNGILIFGGGYDVDALVASNNTIYSCGNHGISIEDDLTNSMFAGNIIYGNTGDGVSMSIGTYSMFSNNVIYDNTVAFDLVGTSATNNNVFINNLAFNTASGTTQTYGMNMGTGGNVANNIVMGNVFWQCDSDEFNVGATERAANVFINPSSQGGLKIANYTEILTGTSTPEGAVSANTGSIFLRQDGSADTMIYTKVSGTGTTLWKAVENVP